ncbi:MAG: mechanosensitive ion channel family protein, partial [Planctomycetota bacterium]
LALQKPLEDLFGALTIFTRQPVRVGDFCRFGDRMGTVEEIGLRTTRVRTLANTLVSVPNARFANEFIENVSARGSIRYHHHVRLRYETTPEQARAVLDGIRALLAGHPKVLDENQRARLTTFGEHALVIEVSAYVGTTNYVEYLGTAEELNLGIMDAVAGAGARFAIPLEALRE